MKIRFFLPAMLALSLIGCSNVEPNPDVEESAEAVTDGEGETQTNDPDYIPDFNYEIAPYSGETASDAVSYQAGNADLNPDETDWANVVTVVFNGSSASVNSSISTVKSTIVGANVDLSLGSTKQCKVIVSGTSTSGSLRLSGNYKHLLELDNLTLTSNDRPAINDQIGKRTFVVLKGHNKIEDGSTYISSSDTKRKGCFYAASHVVLCGDGVLEVKGNYRHGFATDGFLFVNPGVTLAVTDAKKNAIHVDGSGEKNSYRGIEILGGYVYANTSADAGKAMKCDRSIRLRGGVLSLNCSGNAAEDSEDPGTLSSPACIKSDSTVTVTKGQIVLTATGNGAKGISADVDIIIGGGELTIANSGSSVIESSDNSVAKALNANGSISVSAGNVYMSAKGDGSTAISSDANFTMTDGVIYAFGANYGIKTAGSGNVSGGNFICGGGQNTAVKQTVEYTYTDVEAEHIEPITNADGDVVAAFQWPVALSVASLLYY